MRETEKIVGRGNKRKNCKKERIEENRNERKTNTKENIRKCLEER